jgi:hypothetical protein
MPVGLTSTDPIWTQDDTELERQVATFAKANGITTQTQWATFIAGITTLAQCVAVCKGILTAVKCSVP